MDTNALENDLLEGVAPKMMSQTDVDLSNARQQCRELSRMLMEQYEILQGAGDATFCQIMAQEKVSNALGGLRRIIRDFGVFLVFPIFRQEELKYRLKNPSSTIPQALLGTLIDFDSYHMEPEELRYDEPPDLAKVPLVEDRGWKLANAMSALSPEVVTVFEELPYRMSLARSPYRCEVQTYGLIELLVKASMDNHALRYFLSELDGESPNVAQTPDNSNHQPTNTSTNDGFAQRTFPDFDADEWDMEDLAFAFLDEFIHAQMHEFTTGWSGKAYKQLEKFESIAGILGNEERSRIIEAMDVHQERERGDDWHVYKRACNPGFWPLPVNDAAVLRVANSVLCVPDENLHHYGESFLKILREAKSRSSQGLEADGSNT
jgi:hypothetical protein